MPSPEIPTLRVVLFEDTAAGSFGAATATVATAKAADCPTDSASRQVRWPPLAILCPTVQPSGRSPLKTEHSCSACSKTAVARRRAVDQKTADVGVHTPSAPDVNLPFSWQKTFARLHVQRTDLSIALFFSVNAVRLASATSQCFFFRRRTTHRRLTDPRRMPGPPNWLAHVRRAQHSPI